MEAKQSTFTSVSKEANELWTSAIDNLGVDTVESIRKNKASMSASQEEAATTQRDVAARLFDDQEEALKNIKKGGVNNPSLSKLGNDLIWGIYHADTAVAQAGTREERNNAGVALSSLNKSLTELYQIIEIGKDTDAMFMIEYFGLEDAKNPGQAEGMALVGRDTPVWCKTMAIRSGLAGDDASEEYYIGEVGEIRLKYSGSLLNGMTVDKPALTWLAYDPGVILNLKAENIKMLQTPSSLDVDGKQVSIIDNSLQYNDAYLLLDKKYLEVSKDGKMQTEFIPANMAKIINDTKAKSTARANSLLNNYDDANRTWRNNFNKEEDLKFGVAANGKNIDADQQAEFQELMFSSLKPLLPTVAVGQTTEVVKEEVQPEMVEEEVLTADQFN
jgi:hypothetical protein